MRKILLLCFFTMVAGAPLLAQQAVPPQYDAIKFKTKQDYKTNQPVVLQAANYLLTTPVIPNDIGRLKVVAFLTNWMQGTPDHTFLISEYPTKYFSNNLELMSVYMASLCKAALENNITDSHEMVLAGTDIFLTYISNPAYFKDKLTKDLKRLTEAQEKGRLKSYLKM